ncbi:MAG TPA: CBS domain-containing protein [Candidatus Nitrosotalea sp.]|nr:CBS domain-containing protein [Candidatus Nitrosotalea sp.]
MKELLQKSLLSSPIVSVKTENSVTEATNLLPHNLESFTDSLVVTLDDKPIGLVGGIEILDGVLKKPHANFFENTKIKEIMSKNLIVLTDDTTLGDLLNLWVKAGRAFAIVPNAYHGYSAISARRLLEVGMSCRSKLTVSDISKKKINTFRKDQTIKEIIESMFKNKTRKLMLEGTSEFISDRIIIQKISRDLNCLHGVGNFLDMKGNEFKLDKAKKVSNQTTMEEACAILYEMQSPYLLLSDGVVTPWDVITNLGSENMEYNSKFKQ